MAAKPSRELHCSRAIRTGPVYRCAVGGYRSLGTAVVLAVFADELAGAGALEVRYAPLLVEEEGVDASDVGHVDFSGFSPPGDERGGRDELDAVPAKQDDESVVL